MRQAGSSSGLPASVQHSEIFIMDGDASLHGDCRRCAGLCCVALAFDRSALFGEDKPAGQVCRHLSPADRCCIHADRASSGYAGCVAYDCLGAGQLATQLFGGRSWRDCADGGRAMFAAFAQARRVHEWRQLLASGAEAEHDAEATAVGARETSATSWRLDGGRARASRKRRHECRDGRSPARPARRRHTVRLRKSRAFAALARCAGICSRT